MSFNQNSVVQSLSAASPEQLTKLLRQITVETQILGFTADASGHHCYFRCMQKIKVVDGKSDHKEGGIQNSDRLDDA